MIGKKDAPDPKRLVDEIVTINFDLGNGRAIALNTNMYADETEEQKSARLDAIMARLERQRARSEVEILEAELRTREKRLHEIDLHIEQTVAQIEAHEKMTGPRRPNWQPQLDQLRSALENHKLNRKRMEPEIEEGRKNVEEGRRRAA